MAHHTANNGPLPLEEKIDWAIKNLSIDLNARYVNFFEEYTLADANLHTQIPNKRYIIATGSVSIPMG